MHDELTGAYVRAYLKGVSDRAAHAAEAFDWVDGKQQYNPTELVPPFAEGSEGQKAFNRFKEQIQSLGPRALRFKRDGAIGAINWGGKNPEGIDERLENIDLREFAREALKNLFTTGIAAMWAYQPEDGSNPRIQRLGGHVEPLYREDDAAGEVVGLYQVRAEATAELRYYIRIYEFDTISGNSGTIYEWRNARDAFEIGKAPSNTIENASMPRYQLLNRDADGLPLGEFSQALPTIKGEVAQQFRILRVSDGHAFPLNWAVGDWDLEETRGANTVLVSSELGSSIGRLEPSDLSSLFTQQDRLMERFRGDLALPISSIATGNFPSGEALEQANGAFLTSCAGYARQLSALLTAVVADYCELLGIPRESAPLVSVEVNQENARRSITEQARNDYKARLISFRAAVTTIAAYYPAWESKDVEEFINAGSQQISIDDLDSFGFGEAGGA